MKNNKTIQELKETRVKTTFKVEVEIDLPYYDHQEWIDQRLEEVIKKVYDQICKRDTEGHLNGEDAYCMGHKYEVFYGYDEEEEYNIND
jgi:hypothetical protein